MTRPRLRLAVLGTVAAALLVLGSTGSATAALTHPRLVAPKRATVFAKGSRPTFKVIDTARNAQRYSVFMVISKTKRFKTRGYEAGDLILTRPGTFAEMKRKGSTFTYKTEKVSFRGWFMNTPGKYYWQAFHTDCRQRGSRCHVHSSLGSFVVR